MNCIKKRVPFPGKEIGLLGDLVDAPSAALAQTRVDGSTDLVGSFS